ncbi:MAG: hypothetical protein IPM34_13600 [Saprospiraceae bacterium]|nr:hypothetical protein [Saprospiraceae bacterium]
MKVLHLVFLFSLLNFDVYAQEYTVNDSTWKAINNDLKILKNIKVSGYLQAQYQIAEEQGIKYPGGNFASNVDNRFSMRRARLKVAYVGKPFEWVLVTENTERGISLHDVYGSYTFSKIHLKYTAGLFPRPFGFEQSYSTAYHEGPERVRFSTTLLPAEADLGCKLTYSALKPITLELGVYNGTATAADFDGFKDIVARISIQKKLNTSNLSGGLSFYSGGVVQGNPYRYSISENGSEPVFSLMDTTSFAFGSKVKREYLGADVQYQFSNILGTTTLRAEFVQGEQPGSASNTDSPKTNTAPQGDSYSRNFNAFSAYFLQKIGSSNFMFVAKYDWYDPNSDVEKNEIGTSLSKTGAADVKYSTLGLGLNYYFKNMYIMFYYDMITNEKSENLNGFQSDLKDNVFTIRTQFKF